MGSNLAPVVLFVHARPKHTRLTLEALSRNELAELTELFVFCDGANNHTLEEAVSDTRSIIRSWGTFKSIKIIENDKNLGLAKSIIEGVTQIFLRYDYDKVIVLEDDVITSKYFLRYMNEALNLYQFRSEIWHINAWNYPIDNRELPQVYLSQIMHCWGWGTWRDRWAYFRKDPLRLISEWTESKIRCFNLGGAYNFWHQIEQNASGKLETWAVFWYATIFEYEGLCVTPSVSLSVNIGFDGTGANCSNVDIYKKNIVWDKKINFPQNISHSDIANKLVVRYLKAIKSILSRSFRLGMKLGAYLKRIYENKDI